MNPTDNMIERVAEALIARRIDEDKAFQDYSDDQKQALLKLYKDSKIWESDARTAIAAMREPTQAMWDAAANCEWKNAAWTEVPMEGAYLAMIDAALEEDGTQVP